MLEQSTGGPTTADTDPLATASALVATPTAVRTAAPIDLAGGPDRLSPSAHPVAAARRTPGKDLSSPRHLLSAAIAGPEACDER